VFNWRRLAMAVLAVSLSGLWASAASAQPAPGDDNYLSSFKIPQAATTGSSALTFTDSEDTTNATTQSDLFNPDKNGMPFGGAGPEPVTCDGVTYGKTIWYDLHPRIQELVELEASGFPTAISIYQWSPATALITRRIGCQVSEGSLNDFTVLSELHAHTPYTVQVGGLSTPTGFASGPIEFTAAIYPDHDGDTVPDQIDACPTLAGIRRLSGCPPRIDPSITLDWRPAGGSALALTQLRVGSLPGGARVEARCRSCGLDQVKTTGRHGGAVSMSAFLGRALPEGATLQIWATKRATRSGDYRYGAIGGYASYPVQSGTIGTRVSRCLMPGSLTPRVTCPPGGTKKH
jgi:hypothetical protein